MSIYDIIAMISRIILKDSHEYDVVTNYICLKEPIFLESKISRKLNEITQMGDKLLLSEDYQWLEKYISELSKKNQHIILLELLSQLDTIVNYDESSYKSEDDYKMSFDPLNEIFLDDILVLPKMVRRTNWTHSIDEISGSVNSILNSVLIVPVSELHGFNLKNHFIDLTYSERNFKVSGSPITSLTEVFPNHIIEDNINLIEFKINYNKEFDFISQFIRMVHLADTQKAALFACPELISTKEMNELLIEKLKTEKFTNVHFIALPSYYDDETSQNIGEIYYTINKKIIIKQSKSFAYVKLKPNEKQKEHLSENKDIHIMHINGVGRIIFPICRDMLVDKYILMCRAVSANVIITRSFSPGVYGSIYFSRIIRAYTSFECCGFWINSCSYKTSAEESNKKVYCISAHSKEEGDEYNKECRCTGKCNECLTTFVAN